MGWNSWDCFGTTVTEPQVRDQAQVMASKLKPYGWQYVVVDIQWYEPESSGFDYRPDAPLTMDGYGRLLPAPNKFPSSANRLGFTGLANYVHRLDLKFGVHLMRGIPKQAVHLNLPIFGTTHHAQDIANREDGCPWNPDNYGVDVSKPGGQDYYDGVFELLASWGVDFVKVDDISRPYMSHQAEIEAIRQAIDRTGRDIVLSLSPGETALQAGDHVLNHANMWRISDDFWDSWPLLVEQFDRCANWSRYSGPGHFPDADMLPLGKIRFGEQTRFTPTEQETMLTLFAIARSPLMLGCDLTKLDAATLELITNPKLIRVNQEGRDAEEIWRRGDQIVWRSRSSGHDEIFLAFFNLGDEAAPVSISAEELGVKRPTLLRDLWGGQEITPQGNPFRIEVPAHGSRLFSAL